MKEKLPPLQGLYYFYKAAELGSFKMAANRLFVSAAAVSQQIRQLEESLCTGQVQQDTFFREFSNSIGDRSWFAECSLSKL